MSNLGWSLAKYCTADNWNLILEVPGLPAPQKTRSHGVSPRGMGNAYKHGAEFIHGPAALVFWGSMRGQCGPGSHCSFILLVLIYVHLSFFTSGWTVNMDGRKSFHSALSQISKTGGTRGWAKKS
jgi:hypothetical protein